MTEGGGARGRLIVLVGAGEWPGRGGSRAHRGGAGRTGAGRPKVRQKELPGWE